MTESPKMTPLQARKGQRGFTLVEIMIALAILAIALTGVVALFLRTHRHNQVIHEGRTNLKACQEVMEVVISDLKMMQFSGSAPNWSGWMGNWNSGGGLGTTAFFDVNAQLTIGANLIDFRSGVRSATPIGKTATPGHKELSGFMGKVEITDLSVGIGAVPFSIFEIRTRVFNRTNLTLREEQLITWRSTK